MAKRMAIGIDVDLARKFAFSAATLIQSEPADSQTWGDIVADLERATKYAQQVANNLAMAEERRAGQTGDQS